MQKITAIIRPRKQRFDDNLSEQSKLLQSRPAAREENRLVEGNTGIKKTQLVQFPLLRKTPLLRKQ